MKEIETIYEESEANASPRICHVIKEAKKSLLIDAI
jgi:hypothetical protein